MLKTLTFIRHNAIALLALLVALGGTSYATFTINGNQIRNRTIDAIKLDPKSISASIRAWAIVYGDSSSATAGPSSSHIWGHAIGTGEVITWTHRRFGTNCMPIATPLGVPSTRGYGSVSTQFDAVHRKLGRRGMMKRHEPHPSWFRPRQGGAAARPGLIVVLDVVRVETPAGDRLRSTVAFLLAVLVLALVVDLLVLCVCLLLLSLSRGVRRGHVVLRRGLVLRGISESVIASLTSFITSTSLA